MPRIIQNYNNPMMVENQQVDNIIFNNQSVNLLKMEGKYQWPVMGSWAMLAYSQSRYPMPANSDTPFAGLGSSYISSNFVVPEGVHQIHVVCIGAGGGSSSCAGTSKYSSAGGGGGSLAYVNDISVTPGENLWVVVGRAGAGGDNWGNTSTDGRNGGDTAIGRGSSVFVNKLCHAGGGNGGWYNSSGGNGGNVIVGTGGSGGRGGNAYYNGGGGGGGGAGGYAGNGGNGGIGNNSSGASAATNSGGAGGGGGSTYSGRVNNCGGGVAFYGKGHTGRGAPHSSPGEDGSYASYSAFGAYQPANGSGYGKHWGGGAGGIEDDTPGTGVAGAAGALCIRFGPLEIVPRFPDWFKPVSAPGPTDTEWNEVNGNAIITDY